MTTALEALDERCLTITSVGLGAAPSAGEMADLHDALGDKASRVRAAATRALGSLLAREGALDALLAAEVSRRLADVAVFDPHLWTRQAAASALAHAADAAIERLGAIVRAGEAEGRERAARAIGHWGRGGAGLPPSRARLAERALAPALRDPNPRVRAAAAEALGALPALDEAVAALAAAARDDADPAVRVAALGALGDAGVVDRDPAFDAVAAALGDEIDEVVVAALEAALAARRPDRPARLLTPLRALAQSHAEAVRVAAMRALASLGAAAASALDDVVAAATHRSWAVREQAVETFGELVAHDPSFVEARVPSLVASTTSGDRYVGLRLLHRVGAVPESLAPAVWVAALEDRDARTRDLARELVGSALGPDAHLPERLLASLRHARPTTRARAAELARRLGPAASPLVPALLRAVPDPSRKVRKAAVGALGAIGEAALPGLPPALRRAFEGESTVVGAAQASVKSLAAGLAPELSARVINLLRGQKSETLLLSMLEGPLPPDVEAELARLAQRRAHWHASLGAETPPPAPPADAPPARAAVAAALDAADAAALRRKRPDTGPGARQREAAWLLALVVRGLMRQTG
jgi:HEAT repeat protein